MRKKNSKKWGDGMDLISREALNAVLQRYKFGAITNEAEREYTKDTVLDFVADQPTIEAVPVVHGEVVTKTGNWGVMHQECSVCGEGLEWKSYPNFCPECGADLRKKV